MKIKLCSGRISAKRISKLRRLAKIYLVLRSRENPGFAGYDENTIQLIDLNNYTEVLARYPMEAAYRYMRRKKALIEFSRYDMFPEQIDRGDAKLRIISKDNLHEEFVTYWR